MSHRCYGPPRLWGSLQRENSWCWKEVHMFCTMSIVFFLYSYLGKGLTEHTASSCCNSKALWTHPGSASKCSSGDNHHRGICSFSICYSRCWGPFRRLTCLELEEMGVELWKRYCYFLWTTPFNFWVCWIRLSIQFGYSVPILCL